MRGTPPQAGLPPAAPPAPGDGSGPSGDRVCSTSSSGPPPGSARLQLAVCPGLCTQFPVSGSPHRHRCEPNDQQGPCGCWAGADQNQRQAHRSQRLERPPRALLQLSARGTAAHQSQSHPPAFPCAALGDANCPDAAQAPAAGDEFWTSRSHLSRRRRGRAGQSARVGGPGLGGLGTQLGRSCSPVCWPLEAPPQRSQRVPIILPGLEGQLSLVWAGPPGPGGPWGGLCCRPARGQHGTRQLGPP